MKKIGCLTLLLWVYSVQFIHAQCLQDLTLGAFDNYYLPSDYNLCSDLRADLSGANGITSATVPASSLTIPSGSDITITATTFSIFYLNLIIEENAILRIEGNMQIEDADVYVSSYQIDGQLIVSGDLSTSAWSFENNGVGENIMINGNGSVQVGGNFNSGTINPDYISDGITWDLDCDNITGSLYCSDLPVELTYFQASPKEGSVLLEWETATEINASHFEIEKTSDRKVWEKIGTLKASGNSQVPIAYQFEDKVPYSSTYYRLKQIDFDGTFAYYGPISVMYHAEQQLLNATIIPNRITNGEEFQLSISGLREDNDMQIQIYNSQGHQVYSEEVQSIKAHNFLKTINFTSQLASGMYYVIIKSGKDSTTKKLMVN
ncbi:T9SS type A sorting domain-containing protein [Flammeovirga sp. EKP202]|uniref:T9SS type A sorting domain-containing protein n=1 Tax=Flammeovirga sp. EKP202 TaxID=2770592 RepID=UPI00165F5825|nr:T9SS type A sorting domain-containing protein [Flammeovirga sp. EKP202]MBD0399917.1 T9SS type A sorting domain-containing protein [Flammeovirga sp. EKP202]